MLCRLPMTINQSMESVLTRSGLHYSIHLLRFPILLQADGSLLRRRQCLHHQLFQLRCCHVVLDHAPTTDSSRRPPRLHKTRRMFAPATFVICEHTKRDHVHQIQGFPDINGLFCEVTDNFTSNLVWSSEMCKRSRKQAQNGG